MFTKVTYINIEADCEKDGKLCHIKVSNQLQWDDDYSDSVVFGSISELFYEAEKQGFMLKNTETKVEEKKVLDTVGTVKEMVQETKTENKEQEQKQETTTKKNRWGLK